MADIPQLLANYDALVGVALGAGLTYGFGALNRRHQEARETKRAGTRRGFRHSLSFTKLRMMPTGSCTRLLLLPPPTEEPDASEGTQASRSHSLCWLARGS
jgi:hypothetical protein